MYDINRCYQILELPTGAAHEDIHQSYRDLLMVWHPDRFPGNPRLQRKAQEKTAHINEAYQRLQSSLHANYAGDSPFGWHDTWHTAEETPGASTHGPYEEHAAPQEETETASRHRQRWTTWARRCAAATVMFLLAIAVTAEVVEYMTAEKAEVVIKREAKTEKNEPAETLKAYQEAVQKNSKDSIAHYRLGEAYAALARHDDALAAFRNAVRFRPDYADAYYRLGLTYAAIGRHDQAVEVYKQAIRSKPDHASAHYNLSESYWKLGRYHDANDAYTRALHAVPEDNDAYTRFMQQGQRGIS